MNYKINNLLKPLECTEEFLPEFPDLLKGTTPDNVAVFDSTAYCKSEGLQEYSAATFGKICHIYIERMIESGNLNVSCIFYLTPDGHLLINQSLVYIYLATINPGVFEYFLTLINDIMRSGMAFSDTYLLSLVSSKIPTEYLKQIIESRQ